jgi:hypothetical protein
MLWLTSREVSWRMGANLLKAHPEQESVRLKKLTGEFALE